MKSRSYSEKIEHRERRSVSQSVQGRENCSKVVKKLIKCIKQQKKVSDDLVVACHSCCLLSVN